MKKKILKILIALTACILIACTAVVIPVVYAFSLPKQYNQTYVAAMSDKIELLKNTKESKIVLIGGSSLAFGIDSELLSSSLGKPVVNLGLYAALGGKIMLDLSKAAINKGDLVVISFEYSAQMYSKYINPETTLQMLDADFSLAGYIDKNDMLQLLGGIPNLITQKRQFIDNNNKPAPPPPYSRDAFNKLGDISYPCEWNEMALKYDTNMLIDINKSIISSEFITYFNDYVKYVRSKKAEIVISFPPVNRLGLSENCDEEKILEFYNFVRSKFNAEVISYPGDHVIHQDYFYDSNYHLNDTGTVLFTDKLLGDIKRHLNDTTANNIVVPKGSGARPKTEEEPIDPNADGRDDFSFVEQNGQIIITGISEQGKTKNKLTIPSKIDEKTVFMLENRAFADCPLLSELDIPSSVTSLGNELFASSPMLTAVNLRLPSDITRPLPQVGDGLLTGANSNLKIYVENARYGQITSDYFWSRYAQRISIRTN